MAPDKHVNEELILNPDIISKAQTGEHSSQLEIGRAYYRASHVEDNCYSAFKWIKASADQGNAEAQFLLADMYSLGHGVDRDTLAAHEWYTKSALHGYIKALIRVHNLYHEDKKIHCRDELSSEEEGMNEPEFKKNNGVRELNEYRLKTMQAKHLLGNTMDFFSVQFKDLTESDSKDADSYYKLGFLYHHGYGIREIHSRAIECYTLAGEKGHIHAQYNMACLYQENTDIKFNYRHALKWFKLAAEAGHSSAQNSLAYFFEKGIVVEMDFSEALCWYTKAAASNNKGAMVNIARMYRKGLIVDQPKYSQSIEWYKKAAQLGSSVAKNCLYQLSQRKDNTVDSNDSTEDGLLYGGSSVKDRLCSTLRLDMSTVSDHPKFCQLEKLASHALVGDRNAMFKLGIKYFNRSTFTQNRETGLKWIQNAAKSGLLKAQLLMGKLLENGRTDIVKQDYHKAVIWYFLAAKQKNHVAQHNVGLFYYHGHSLRKDLLEASRWFTWSADQNNSNAQCMLGLLRRNGEGLRKDEFEAFQWFKKSGSRKNPQALYYFGLIKQRGTNFSKDGTIKKGQVNEVLSKEAIKIAISAFEYAANHGCLNAQLLYAEILDEGYLCHLDSNKAFIYYMLAAKQGNTEANYKIGYMYLEGKGIKQDFIQAYKHIAKAAEKGHHVSKSLLVAPIKERIKSIDYSKVLKMFEAVTHKGLASLEYNIGCFYENGFGDYNPRRIIEKEPSRSLHWYHQAEKKNIPEAIHKLGTIYLRENFYIVISYYKKGIKLGHLDSVYELAQLYLVGNGVTKDAKRAFNLFSEAASLGHPGARSVLSLLYETKATIANPFKNDSVKGMMEEVGNKGNTIVQYRFGCYYESSGDIKLAIKWHELATRGKLTDAYYRLGRIYEIEGYQNLPKAIELYEAASDNYHDEATYREARLYHYGNGIPQNYSKAFQLYTKAANLGNRTATELLDIKQVFKRNCLDNSNDTGTSNTTAIGNTTLKLTSEELKELLLMYKYISRHGDANQQYNVGYVYENGLETPDYEKAFRWYSISASSNHKDAIYRIGLLYLNGNSRPQNLSSATEMFKKAMDLGSADACYQLGLMSGSGRMTDIDYPKAEYYFILAANKGHYDAQFKLGQLYEDGYIEGKGFLDTLKWYTKAFLQTSNQAILHLDELDDDPNFIIRHYSKQFPKLTRYGSHRLGKFSEDDSLNHEKNTGQSLQFYGFVHYQLGYIYINGFSVNVSYKEAWYHFNKAQKVFNTKQALYFTNAETEGANTLEAPMYLKKMKMFSAVAHELDAEQSYQFACVVYNGNRNHNHDISILNLDDEFAFGLLKKSAKEGYLKSKKLLGDMYYFGYGVTVDLEKSLLNHIEYSSSQDGQENFRAGVEYYDSKKYNSQGWNIALVYIFKASNQENIDAQKYLSDMLYSGQNAISFTKGIGEMHKALADQQSACENMDTGIRYLYGYGNTKIDPFTGLVYLQRAADQNNYVAQRILGDLYHYGTTVDKNHYKAKKLHSSSSRQLSGSDCIRMAENYFNDSTLFTEYHEIAFNYLTESITKGNYNARRYLNNISFPEDVAEVNREKALQLHENFAATLAVESLIKLGQIYYDIEYYSIAAIYMIKTEDNNSTTLRRLGNMYHEAGLIYINEAINQGFSTATQFIADKYYYGDGVIDKDQVKSMEIHNILANRGNGYEAFCIGKKYYQGTKYLKNTTVGLIYLNIAAFDKSSPEALRYLGDLFYYGDNDTDKDQVKALELHKTSAKLDWSFNIVDIGKGYYEGSEYIEKNTTVGLIYLNTAAFDRNSSDTLRYLGDLFYYGDSDTDKDEVKGLELHTILANRITAFENFRIGESYYEGLCYNGLKYLKNTTIGLIYLNTAAFDRNSPQALRYLGDLFFNGDSTIGKDKVRAFELYKASEKNTLKI